MAERRGAAYCRDMVRGPAWVLALLLSAATVAAPVAVPAHASEAPPTLTLTLREDPAMPHYVGPYGRLFRADVTSAGGTAEDVTVTFSGPAVYAEPAVHALGSVSGSEPAFGRVTLESDGLSELTVEVVSSNAGTVSTTLPLLWTPGGTPLPATGDLAGRHYGWRVDYYELHVGYVADDHMVSFLDDHRAYVGAAPKGRPRCPSVEEYGYRGCVTYRYDASTGLVQIGGYVGRVLGPDLYLSGIGRAETINSVSERIVSQRWRYARKRQVVDGHWRLEGSQHVVDLTLRPDRTFRLVAGAASQTVETTGTFRIPRRGKLVMRGAAGREVHTLAVRLGPDGRPAPGLGLWYTGPASDGTVDSFRLDPVS